MVQSGPTLGIAGDEEVVYGFVTVLHYVNTELQVPSGT